MNKEDWHERKPKVNHFRVFGSEGYAHTSRAKFYSKTRKCVMLGYENVTKGCRLHELAHKRIFHSCDVQFCKIARGCSQASDVPDTRPDNDYQLIAEFPEVPDHDFLSSNDTDHDQQPNNAE